MQIPDIDGSLEGGKGERYFFVWMVLFMERCLREMGVLYKNMTPNATYTNNFFIEQRHIYTKYENTDARTDQYFSQTRHGLTHIIRGTTIGWTVMKRDAGRCLVGRGRGS